MTYYGLKLYGNETLEGMAYRIVTVLGECQEHIDILVETACAETAAGTLKDPTRYAGMGLTQFDKIPFQDVVRRTRESNKAAVFEHFGVDLDDVHWEELRHNPMLALIMTRLKYKLIPAPIPKSLEGRAAYWKEHYNTEAGKGTVKHYIEAVNHYRKAGTS